MSTTEDCDHGSFCAFPSYEAKHRLEIPLSMMRKCLDFSSVRTQRVGGKNRLMKAVQISSHISIVPLFSSSNHVFASLEEIRETSSGGQLHSRFPLARVKWLPLMANSFAVSGMVIAEPRVGATTRSAAHMGSSSMGLRF
ncbi:hypothetical protein Tco_0949190 [Tanacetum coccineum]